MFLAQGDVQEANPNLLNATFYGASKYGNRKASGGSRVRWVSSCSLKCEMEKSIFQTSWIEKELQE